MSEPESTSPPPDASAAGPSPLLVGKRFVKQYYQVLSTTPDQIHRFYQADSYLSHGEGSNPTDPERLEDYKMSDRWGDSKVKSIQLENGAIDAQPSVNGGILLVVTGHVVFTGKEEQRAFTHTFFLATLGNSKRFYVHNDILRFLHEQQKSTVDVAVETVEIQEEQEEPKPAPVEVDVEPEVAEQPMEPEEVVEDLAPGGGVEESKEEPADEEDEVAAGEEKVAVEEEVAIADAVEEEMTPTIEETKEEPDVATSESDLAKDKSAGKGKKTNRGGRGRSPPAQLQQPQQPAQQQPASKPVPGSWASLVALGGGPTAVSTPVAASPAKPPAPAKVEPKIVVESEPSTGQAPDKELKSDGGKTMARGDRDRDRDRGDRPKRDPDCTLVIKNLADGTKESDLRALFEPFATQTKGKIVGTTVSSHKGLAFVDFDSVAPVLAAVEKHSKEAIQLSGRVLEVDQKTAEQRARRNMRGGYRGGSPGNGSEYRDRGSGGGSGGGRHNQFRRGNDGRGRGDRGGGTGGRGGRGGR